LTHKEIVICKDASRERKGLCYNCEEKFRPGHKCKAQDFLLIGDEGEDSDPAEFQDDESKLEVDEVNATMPEISLYALDGKLNPKTLKITGKFATYNVNVLIDGESTDKFIRASVATKLGLSILAIKSFGVLVGNGDTLFCDNICIDAPLKLQVNVFKLDIYVLRIKGSDVVLVIQWFELLGPIWINNNDLTMEFTWEWHKVKLTGESQLNM
ncbi:RVP_2 domain-containing protein, partial [Cephalotus follicularis]